ncbi:MULTISPECIES: ester cyclase [unclassified Gordonia (in: high G+C Gram-positive bacteria)]|uniref:ester cyclase n=1 Tax=unclassified Gordonia (in: high G+C Gram-positive bacteria) TaxID=2657482 RepID=UPI001F0DCBFA|nr:ester cyclase [Gordonia sp. ABSL49_1]MCH5643868.1 ester cyclase [Gordonia sp. ABSL49_1]
MYDTSNPALPSVHRIFDAINTGQLDAIPEVVTDDFVDHGSPVPLPPGPAGYTQILGFVTGVLDVRYEIADIVSTSDRIIVRAKAYGRGVSAVHGEAGAGKPYEMDTLHIYRTEGTRLAEHWGVRDELGVLIQLGVVPAPQLPPLPEVGAR